MENKFAQLTTDTNQVGKDILKFRVDFYNESLFKNFVNTEVESLFNNYKDVCITGYFSDGIAKILTKNLKGLNTNVRIITQEHNLQNKRDRQNLASLRKIQDAGVEIIVNQRVHCRMFLCRLEEYQGLLVLGSFDFNKEGMNEERRDAGIFTQHPDLVESSFKFFNEIWEDRYDSTPLNEMYPP